MKLGGLDGLCRKLTTTFGKMVCNISQNNVFGPLNETKPELKVVFDD